MLRLALVEELRRLAADVVAARRSRDRARALGRAAEPTGDAGARTAHRRDAARRGGSERTPVGRLRRRAAALAARSAVVGRAGVARAAARARGAGRLARRDAARSSTSARRPTSSPSATSSRACGCCRRSTGRCSSSGSAWSSRSCARILPAPTRGWTSRPATATATRSRSWRERRKTSEQDVARRAVELAREAQRTAPGPRSHASRRLLPDLARPVPARARGRLPADAARALRAVRLRPSGARLSRHDRRRRPRWRWPASSPTRTGTAATRRDLWIVALVVAAPAERARHQPAQPHRHVAGHAAAAAEARHAGGHPGARSHDGRRAGDRRLRGAADVAARRSRSPVLRQPRPAPALRAADRLRRRRRSTAARATTRSSTRARRRIDELNARHGADRFFLFHRARRWNAGEGRWMGWERKRGKLDEFNRLLRGATDTSFIVQHGDLSILPSIRYVITLDSDTQLPMEAGTAAGRHAVASAEPAALRRRACSASPKATASCSRASASASSARTGRRSRRCSPGTSASIRTRRPCPTSIRTCFTKAATSARASTTSTRSRRRSPDRVPENTLLSHDLFEGFYARAGLVHRHRPRRRLSRRTTWRSPRASTAGCAATGRSRAGCGAPCRTPSGRAVPNTLPVISRWKILDNLRRSLLPPALVAAARCGLDRPAGIAGAVDHARRCSCSRSPRTSRSRDRSAATRRACPLREHLRAERDTIADEPAAGGVLDRHPRAPERGDARRHRPHARSGCWSRAGACSSG